MTHPERLDEVSQTHGPQDGLGEEHTQPSSSANSLRVELIASLALVLAMAVVSLSFISSLNAANRHDEAELARLQDHARGLAAVLVRDFRGGELDRSHAERTISTSLAGGVGIIRAELHRLGGPRGPQQILGAGLAQFELPPPQPEGGISDQLRQSDGAWVIDQPMVGLERSDPKERVVLRLIAEASPWSGGIAWGQTLLLATGVALVSLLLGGALLERSVLAPVRSLERALEGVSEGRLDTRLEETGPTELRALAQGFNRMTGTLARQSAELRDADDALRRSEQLASIGRLAAGVAHEVGNPLAAISGYAELLADPRSGLDSESRDLAQRVGSQTQRIQGIVSQLLDLSRPPSIQAESMDLVGAVREAIELMCADPRSQQVEIIWLDEFGAKREVPHERVEVYADPGPVQQIALNLLINACRACRSSASMSDEVGVQIGVRVQAIRRGGAFVEIRDRGEGVPESLRPQLFEPFVSGAPQGEGSGLGLAVSRGLAQAMKGRLELMDSDPQGPWPGARFRLTLPSDPASTN